MEAVLPDPNVIEGFTPWQLNFCQLEQGPMRTAVRVRHGEMLSLLEISMNRAVHQQGMAPPDTLTFGVRLSGEAFRWRDGEVQANRFLTFGGSDGFEGVTVDTFHGLTFSVPQAAVVALAERIGMEVDASLWKSGVFDPSHETHSLDEMTQKALGYLAPRGDVAMDLAAEEEVLIAFLALSADPRILDDLSTGSQRARALRIARDYVQAHADENLPLSEISAVAGVSLRSLNRAFREALGVSPKAYYQRLRLSRFRRALIEGAESETISDAVNALGFWHMGQLARDYRALFGELPSATVA